MRLDEFMDTKVGTIDEDENARDAWDRMQALGTRYLVVTHRQEVCGVVSDRDLAGFCGDAVRAPRTVKALMTESVVTALPTTTLGQAAELLHGRVVGCLPVIEGGNLKGIVTISDLLDRLARVSETTAARAASHPPRSRRTRQGSG